MTITCRCRMCGSKDAGANNQTRSYSQAGIHHSEKRPHGEDKKQSRRLRRRREKRSWT